MECLTQQVNVTAAGYFLRAVHVLLMVMNIRDRQLREGELFHCDGIDNISPFPKTEFPKSGARERVCPGP
jgi:hypothetical protein